MAWIHTEDSSREWLPDKEECRYSFGLLTQSRSNSVSFFEANT